MLVLFLEGPTFLVLLMLYGVVQGWPPGESTLSGFFLWAVLAIPGALVGTLVTRFLVLPAVGVSDLLGRRFSGREVWWWVAGGLVEG